MIIILPFPPSVNTLFGQTKGRQRYKSKQYKNWLAKCPILTESIKGEVSIVYNMYLPDKRKRDLSNYIKAPEDYICSMGVIDDDNHNVIKKFEVRYCGIDRENPRIEIEIKKWTAET